MKRISKPVKHDELMAMLYTIATLQAASLLPAEQRTQEGLLEAIEAMGDLERYHRQIIHAAGGKRPTSAEARAQLLELRGLAAHAAMLLGWR